MMRTTSIPVIGNVLLLPHSMKLPCKNLDSSDRMLVPVHLLKLLISFYHADRISTKVKLLRQRSVSCDQKLAASPCSVFGKDRVDLYLNQERVEATATRPSLSMSIRRLRAIQLPRCCHQRIGLAAFGVTLAAVPLRRKSLALLFVSIAFGLRIRSFVAPLVKTKMLPSP